MADIFKMERSGYDFSSDSYIADITFMGIDKKESLMLWIGMF